MAQGSALIRRQARDSAGGFHFQDVDTTSVWAQLALTATQLSTLTGVSRRRVNWWSRRGYLTPSPEIPDRFNGDAVTLAMLMKQAVDGGIRPARAHELSTQHLAARLARGVQEVASGEKGDETALVDVEHKLRATYNTIGLVLKSLEPMSLRVEHKADLDPGP